MSFERYDLWENNNNNNVKCTAHTTVKSSFHSQSALVTAECLKTCLRLDPVAIETELMAIQQQLAPALLLLLPSVANSQPAQLSLLLSLLRLLVALLALLGVLQYQVARTV